MSEAEDIIDDLYELDATGHVGSTTDMILSRTDVLLVAGDFGVFAELLRIAEVERLSACAMRTLLIQAWHARSRIDSWGDYFVRVERQMAYLMGEEKAGKLLNRFA